MDHDVKSLVDDLLNRHFYSLSGRIGQLRNRYPDHISLIDTCLARYATNVFGLCTPFDNVLPDRWSGSTSLLQNPQTLQVDSVAGYNGTGSSLHREAASTRVISDDQIISLEPVMAHTVSGLHGPGRHWAGNNGGNTNYVNFTHDIPDTSACAHAECTDNPPLCSGSQGFNKTGTQPELRSSLPQLAPRQSKHLRWPFAPDRPEDTLQLTTSNDDVESDISRRPLSHTSMRDYCNEQQREGSVAATEVWCGTSVDFIAAKVPIVSSLRLTICSTEFLEGLKSLLCALRTSCSAEIDLKPDDITSISQAIDHVEATQHLVVIRRRILLWRFAAYREQLVQQVTQGRESDCEPPVGTGPTESQVLDILVMQICPETVEPGFGGNISAWRQSTEVQRKKIKNRLNAAKNWWQAAARYGPGILVLLPSNGEAGWQSRRFEMLTNGQRDELFEIWDQMNGGILSTAALKLGRIAHSLPAGADGLATLRLESAHIPLQVSIDSVEWLLEAI